MRARRLTTVGVAAAMVAATVPAAAGAVEDVAAASPAPAPAVEPAAPAAEPAAPAVEPVAWEPCPDVPGFDCATYAVPRDYADPDGPTLELALTRLPATDVENRVGSLFVNPGGPGGSGVAFAQSAGPFLSGLTGGQFDIVGLDPRGVGGSSPVQCFASAEELLGFGFTGDVVPDSATEFREAQTITAAYTDLCGRQAADVLPFVSTELVARDLDVLRAAVGDEQLTYYGLSYGTVLGATYANLFPDRVRALALDGAVDPVAYTEDVTTWLAGSLADADDVLQGFYDSCDAAGPQRCALADEGARRVTRQVLRDLRRDGLLPAVESVLPGVITEDEVTSLVFNVLYSPALWPALAQALADAAEGDGSGLRDLLVGLVATPADEGEGFASNRDALLAVVCSDTGDDGEAADWRSRTRELSRASRTFGPGLSYGLGLPCATWPAEAASRYGGPWDAETANPVLVIGVTRDPITPLASAERLDDLLGSSRLLVHDGLGHTSLAFGQESTCSLSALGEYLVDQVLPPEGTVCRADAAPFTTPAVAGEQERLGLPETLPAVVLAPALTVR